jgi:hypothetical protein
MKRLSLLLLSIAIALPLSAIPASAAVDPVVGVVTNGLKMYFDPANPNGFLSATVLKDLSGNAFNGTLTKTGSWPGIQTGQGRYLNFDGLGGYVDLPDMASSSNWTGLTITFYGNFGTGANNFERIIDFGNGAVSNNIIVGREGTGGNIFVEIYRDAASGGYCRSTTNSIGNGTWDYWAVTMSGSTCNIYKNNVLNATQAYTYLPWARTLLNNYIGKSNWADAAFEGGISDLAIYDRVLSTAELTQNYNAGVDITSPTVGGGGLSINENTTTATTFTSNESGSYFTIIGGQDSNKYNLNSSSGALTFNTAPNFESPDDFGGDRSYEVQIRVADPSGNYTDYLTTFTIANVNESATLTTPSLSATPTKGIAVTITVTPGGDTPIPPGRVTYLMAGKRIAGCYKKVYTGTGNSTCSWKPTAQGFREITVTFTPTSSTYSAATSKRTFLVIKRNTNR